MTLALYSEPYAPTGNLGDTGIRRLLGAPSLDLLQTVVRESVQNSCDAAKSGRGPRIRFRLRTLTAEQMACLTGEVLVERPMDDAAMTDELHPLPNACDDPVRVLEIIDVGTTGLAGPVRADRIPPGVRYTDFIDFFRNVGTARNTESGGGTYGFGKVALYLASACSTILVDSLSEYRGEPVRRLMGCRLGPAHDVTDADGNACRHTGRHWWGIRQAGDPVADPLEGEAAAALAAQLGMPTRGSEETGTTIMIIAPRLGELEPAAITDRLVDQLLWQFWPRMTIDSPDALRITATVELEGTVLPLPVPERYPPLDHFAQALAKIRAGSPAVRVVTGSKGRVMGSCATVKGLASPRLPSNHVEGRAHAIALMRPVGMVVKYLEGPALANPDAEWAGVFVADSDRTVESAFARAEPPAHDDWQPRMLPSGQDRRDVQTALRAVREIAGSVAGAPQPVAVSAGDSIRSVAAVARALGSLMAGEVARNPEPRRGPRKPGRQKIRARAGKPVFRRIGIESDRAFAEFCVPLQTGTSACVLSIRSGAVLDGALVRQTRSNVGVAVLRVSNADGQELEKDGQGTASYQVPHGQRGELLVRTELPKSMAIGIEVALRLVEPDA